MSSRKLDRLATLLKNELCTILLRDVQNPHIGFATITKVSVSGDLKYARIWVSFLGDRTEQTEHFNALVKSGHFIRRTLAPRVRIKNIPELQFILDNTWESAQRIENILDDLSSTKPDQRDNGSF